MKIYTKKGDDGTTALFGGERRSKSDGRIEAYGTVDELNAAIAVALSVAGDSEPQAILIRVQNELFTLGADLATPMERRESSVRRIQAPDIEWMEQVIDEMEEQLPAIEYFILPGGTDLSARIHLCRTICRRAERHVVAQAQTETINPENLRYLNRLSDLLFVLARFVNYRSGIPDRRWNQNTA